MTSVSAAAASDTPSAARWPSSRTLRVMRSRRCEREILLSKPLFVTREACALWVLALACPLWPQAVEPAWPHLAGQRSETATSPARIAQLHSSKEPTCERLYGEAELSLSNELLWRSGGALTAGATQASGSGGDGPAKLRGHQFQLALSQHRAEASLAGLNAARAD